ncbi:cupin domain-containing protein [Thermoleophilia bacterium SCSIO 60948]|nr:cupin domain-containing protein [Thermoleophilia bacterium SCSIO 60948]
MRSLRLGEAETIPVGAMRMALVRQPLGITGFGANAFLADAGEEVFEAHDETSDNAARHEELYVVVAGRATFTVDDEELDAPAGTIVFCRPGEWRGARATEDATIVLIVGGPEGAAGPIAPWERLFAANRYEDDPERAYAELALALSDWPEHPDVHYNLGCYAARLSRRESALEHMQIALRTEENRHEARTDPDLEPIRSELDLG